MGTSPHSHASTSYTDLATVGPAVTTRTGSTALVILSVSATNDTDS